MISTVFALYIAKRDNFLIKVTKVFAGHVKHLEAGKNKADTK